MKNKFGIIITTYSGDFFLTKALLASIKKFMPTIPICIIQDGNFSLEKEKEIYNITHVIKKENVLDEFLRNNCFGSRCTNMIAFWESPFEQFLYMDSDLVLWGDILKDIDLTQLDFSHNEPHEPYNEFIYKSQYFDFDRLFHYVEKFPWENCHFFNAGVFIGKKGIFDLEVYKELFRLWKEDKSLMPAEPQGMINYMVFNNQSKNQLQVLETHLQTVVPVKSMQELENTFQIVNGEPVVKQNTVIHWAGLKPFMTNKGKVFTLPEIYFRKEHLKNIKSFWRFFPTVYFYYEEFKVVLDRYHNGSILTYLRRKIIKK
jgi:hypothetical protein